MPFDFDRIIDHQLYLATQQCIHPYAQQRRVSSAPAATAAAAGPTRTAGARKSSLGSLVSPWLPYGSGGSGSSSSNNSRKSPALYHHRSRQSYSPVDLFFTAPAGIPARGGSRLYGGGGGETPAQLTRDDSSSSSLDHFVTAPVGDFTIGTAAAAVANGRPPPPHSSGSRPGSSDTDDWTFATASGGSGTGSISGFDTTVDLTPSPPPSLHTGKFAARISSPTTTTLPEQPQPAGPAQETVPDVNRVSAITLQVQDLERAKRFYERVFGAPCPSSSEDSTSATLILNGGALVVTLRESTPDTRRGGGGGGGILLTVSVEDVGEVCRRLRSLAEEGEGEGGVAGQVFAEPAAGRGSARVVTFCDPAGYCWQVGQGVEGP